MRSSWFARILAVLLLACSPGAAFCTSSPAAAAVQAPPAPKLDIHEIRLDNGLRIFVLERTASPTFAGYYQFGVGGASDPKGRSGIAHLLEHMMFKGTERVGTLDAGRESGLMQRLSVLWHQLDVELDRADDPFAKRDTLRVQALEQQIARLTEEHKQLVVKNEYDELMTRAGGVSQNASTDYDVTNYFIQLPSNRLEFWFRLESDRLLHPVFREFWSERDVVHEERRLRLENQAEGMADQALMKLLYQAHPYGTPVVGWPRDIDRLQEEDALAYFRTYYSPSNCIMVLSGDVETDEVQRLAKKYLGAWKKKEIPPLGITTEPEQRGQRRQIVEFDAEPSLYIGWCTVAEGHPDEYALDVLGSILGGLASSRLDKKLVQQDRIASRVSAYQSNQRWSGYMGVDAYLQDGHALPDLEAAVDAVIQGIADAGVTADELERAKVQTEAGRVRSLKSNLGQAFRIATAVGVSGGTDYIHEVEERLNAVTAAEVQAACKKYLQPGRKCVVEVHKTPGVSGATGKEADAAHHHGGTVSERGAKHSAGFRAGMAVLAASKPLALAIPQVGKDVERVVLPSGVTVFLKEDHSAPSVDMSFAWLGGSNTAPVDRLAPFELASQLLTEGGTEGLDPVALEERKEQLGMSFDVFVGGTGSGASFWSLRRDFPAAFRLAMDILMRPRFDPERFEVIRGQYIDGVRRRYDRPAIGVSMLRTHVIYGDHPRLGYVASRGEIERVTPEDIRAVWRRCMGRDNLYVTAVGDFDRQEILALLDSTFAPWRAAGDKRRDFLARDLVLRPGLYVVEKEVSAPAVSLSHQIRVDRSLALPDHAALEILNDILGGSGFRSRLMERLRSDEGLTYGIRSNLFHDGRPGVPGGISVSYQTKKPSVARSIASVVEEFQNIAREPVSPAEVQEQIDAWRNRFVFRFTNDFVVVSRLMQQELDDRPYDYDKQLLDAIQKVTPADVERAARQYVKPENLTVCVFGALTDEDRKSLGEKFALTVLPKEEVFRGGYDRPVPGGAGGERSAAGAEPR